MLPSIHLRLPYTHTHTQINKHTHTICSALRSRYSLLMGFWHQTPRSLKHERVHTPPAHAHTRCLSSCSSFHESFHSSYFIFSLFIFLIFVPTLTSWFSLFLSSIYAFFPYFYMLLFKFLFLYMYIFVN